MTLAVSGNIVLALFAAAIIGAAMTPMFVISFLLEPEFASPQAHTEANASLGSAYNLGSGLAALAAGQLLVVAAASSVFAGAALVTIVCAILAAYIRPGRSISVAFKVAGEQVS